MSQFTEEFEPAAAKEVRELAEKMGRMRTIGEAVGGKQGGLLGYINRKLDSYFTKYPSAKRRELMNNPDTAAWEAARRSLREEVMQHLEEGGEVGVRDARSRYGALEDISREVERRVNVADRAKPVSLSRLLGWVGSIPTAGLSIALGETAHYLNKPDVLVRRGISRMATEQAKRPLLAMREPPRLPPATPKPKIEMSVPESKVMGAMLRGAQLPDEIVTETGLSASQVYSTLTELENRNLAVRRAGNRFHAGISPQQFGGAPKPQPAVPAPKSVGAAAAQPSMQSLVQTEAPAGKLSSYIPAMSPEEAVASRNNPADARFRLDNKVTHADAKGAGTKHPFVGEIGEYVTLYRAVPTGVQTIRPGEYATLSRSYAQDHLNSHLSGRYVENPALAKGGHIISTRVPTRDVLVLGNNEVSWTPENFSQQASAPKVEAPPTPKRVSTPRSESLATYNSLSAEIREAIDAQVSELQHMPQALREGREHQLAQFGGKGTLLKERLAREAARDEGLPVLGEGVAKRPADIKAEIVFLERRSRELNEKMTRMKPSNWRGAQNLIKQLKQMSEKIEKLKGQLEPEGQPRIVQRGQPRMTPEQQSNLETNVYRAADKLLATGFKADRIAYNEPRYNAIKTALEKGRSLISSTYGRSTKLSQASHVRFLPNGEIQIPEGRRWVYLTRQQVDSLARQAGFTSE